MGVDYVGPVAPRPAPPEDAEKTTAAERAHRPRSVEPLSEDRWEGGGHAPEEQEEKREEAAEDVPEGKVEGEGAEEEDSEEVEGGEGEARRGRRLDARA